MKNDIMNIFNINKLLKNNRSDIKSIKPILVTTGIWLIIGILLLNIKWILAHLTLIALFIVIVLAYIIFNIDRPKTKNYK